MPPAAKGTSPFGILFGFAFTLDNDVNGAQITGQVFPEPETELPGREGV